jgi:hypothetical protein
MRKTLVIIAAVLLTAVWAVPPVGASAAAQGMSPSTRLVAAGLGAQGWAAADLTDVTGATRPGDNAALTAVVSEADGGGTQLNVIYRDRNNHARQLYQ